MGSQWKGMGVSLLKIPLFSESIDACTEALKHYNFNVKEYLLNSDTPAYKNIDNTLVAITAIEIGLIDVLRSVGVRPTGIMGHSAGEIMCGYADECLTLEETIQVAYHMGKCISEGNLPTGAMALVGLTWKKALEICSGSEVAPACHNTYDSVTISGPKQAVFSMVERMKKEEIFATVVDTSNLAFHSKHMLLIYERLLRDISMVIPNPKPLTKRWISTSVNLNNSEQSVTDNKVTLCSGEYFANNLKNVVRFHDALKQIPDGAVTIEIAPNALLTPAILKRAIPNCQRLVIASSKEEDGVQTLCDCLDSLRSLGVDVKSTETISSLITVSPSS
ncbi:fatty acid synthase-like [Ciona intestinalis]